MRTTLTLSDEVAALLKRAVKKKRKSIKLVVNEALKLGLLHQEDIAAAKARRPYQTTPYDAGTLLQGDISNIGEILAREDENR